MKCLCLLGRPKKVRQTESKQAKQKNAFNDANYVALIVSVQFFFGEKSTY
jgi:hypothetical protein